MKAELLPPPPPMFKHPLVRSKNKFCEFHNDLGHNTEDCYSLKRAIQDKINNGQFKKWIEGANKEAAREPRIEPRRKVQRGPERKERERSPVVEEDDDTNTYDISYIGTEPPSNRQLSNQIKTLEKIFLIPPLPVWRGRGNWF